MRIAGVRLGAPVARLLSEILAGEGFPDTSARIAEAIERRTTTEAPLTLADHQAITQTLSRNCPATLRRLRQELLEDERRRRRITGS